MTIVFNGCIHNHPQLRDELIRAGHRFFSTSDTEVIAKAYRHWGDGFIDRLNGMFAFCITERDTGRVVLGRDRLGIKPLYLARRGAPPRADHRHRSAPDRRAHREGQRAAVVVDGRRVVDPTG